MPATLSAPPGREFPDPPRKLWTREECIALEKAGLVEPQRYELIEGELIQKMPQNIRHIRALVLLLDWLRGVFGGEVVAQGSSIDVSPDGNPTSVPEPDVVVLARSIREFSVEFRPHDLRLVAEISDSTLRFDLTTKAGLYARAGISEYWVLDINGRRLIVHRNPADGIYGSIVAYAEDERVATLAAPDAEVVVRDLL